MDNTMTLYEFLQKGFSPSVGDVIFNGKSWFVVGIDVPVEGLMKNNQENQLVHVVKAKALDVPVEAQKEKWMIDAIDKVDSESWKSGDKCLINRKASSGEILSDVGVYYGETESHYWLHGIGWRDSRDHAGNIYGKEKYWLTKPESKQQREERERLEAAYDLYCDFTVQRKSFDWFKDENTILRDKWIAIVDKTGYRK